jgi:hypothetical protein
MSYSLVRVGRDLCKNILITLVIIDRKHTPGNADGSSH